MAKKYLNISASKKKTDQLDNFSWSESYISLILGVIVVVVAAVLIVFFFKFKKAGGAKQEISSQKTEATNGASIIYVTKEGDDLTKLSEKFYKTPEKWNIISEFNKLTNPDNLEVGTKLTIPPAKKLDEIPTADATVDRTYIVQEGEDLWDVAVKMYGDGFRWQDIANANGITNPDFVYKGDVLKIPR